jgi:hypothetical protein
MSKKFGLSLILAFVLAVGAFAVQASDTSDSLPPSFDDGRLNAYDSGAPVAVFYTRDEIATVDSDGLATTETVVNGIQLLAWDGGSESARQVLDVSRDAIEQAIAKNTKADFTVAKANGYTLNYSQSGWFWITTPPDSEGKVYTFSWQKDF